MEILQALYAFGGNAPPQLAVMRELVAAGHRVRALAHPAARTRVEATGAAFVGFERTLPGLDLTREAGDPVRDWEPASWLDGVARTRDRVLIGTLGDAFADVGAELARRPADAFVYDWMLLGGAVAAERAGVPGLALVHCPYPGGPAADAFYAPLLEALNAVRTEAGLPPLGHWSEQLRGGLGAYVLGVEELDPAAPAPGVVFAGPAFEPAGDAWEPPWADNDSLVLLSFSTSFMDQVPLAQAALDAVAALPVHALLTAGPALDSDALRVPGNARVEPFVAHSAVLPHAAAVVTHAGWGTVQAALAAGVPLVCAPSGRDQPVNAARVAHLGAGVVAEPTAASIRAGLERVLGDAGFRAAAGRFVTPLARDGAAAVRAALEAR